jgi:hypothetical protein
MQNSQLLDIFCSSMNQFEIAMTQLHAKEETLKNQSQRLTRIVMTALLLVFLGIGIQVWIFATSVGGVVDDINELTKNMGYTQGILNGMSTQVAGIESSVQSVPKMVNLMHGFNEKLPLFVGDMKDIEQDMNGFETSLSQLDTSLVGMNGSMSRLNFEMQLMSKNTKQFARMMP